MGYTLKNPLNSFITISISIIS